MGFKPSKNAQHPATNNSFAELKPNAFSGRSSIVTINIDIIKMLNLITCLDIDYGRNRECIYTNAPLLFNNFIIANHSNFVLISL